MKVKYKDNLYEITEVLIDMPQYATPQRKDVKDIEFITENTQEIQEWENGFDENFLKEDDPTWIEVGVTATTIKSFISQKLKEERQATIEVIKQFKGEEVAQILDILEK